MDILLKTYRDNVSVMLPDEEEWRRMPLFEKRSVEEVLQMLIKDIEQKVRLATSADTGDHLDLMIVLVRNQLV